MKLKTALKNAFLIADRVKAVNGLIATPLCEFPGMKIRRMWVFGSTVKGSQNPNDLDLLIEMKETAKGRGWWENKNLVRLDKRAARRYGFRNPICSTHEVMVWLTKGTQKTSRHVFRDKEDYQCDPETGWIARIDKKVMIYPRNDLKAMVERGEI